MTKEHEISELFELWNKALLSGDPQQVAALYADNAILLPTVSNRVRHNPVEIADYFLHFLSKGPQGKIEESNIRTFDDIAINSGVYTFTFKEDFSVQGRYTFVYHWDGNRWLIIEHHSSVMPEHDIS